MAKINKHIEIVASSNHELNCMGRKSRTDIQAILSKRYARVDITMVNDLLDLRALAARKPDMVFLGMKCIPTNLALGLGDPNKVWLSGYLDDRGIAHTGSSYAAIELELDKGLAKRRLMAVGIKTPRFMVVPCGNRMLEVDVTLSYPLFVKPTNRGGGAGIDAGSLVYTFRQLQSKVNSLATELQSDALIEEYLPGREFSVGILRQEHANRYRVMPLELVAPPDKSGARFLSKQVKLADTEGNLEVVDGLLKTAINNLAIDAFHALGARDYGRIDIRLDAVGVPHFLEANLLPSLLRDYGNFPKTCALNIGLGHEDMIVSIINLAFSRTAVRNDMLHGVTMARRRALLPTHRASDFVATG